MAARLRLRFEPAATSPFVRPFDTDVCCHLAVARLWVASVLLGLFLEFLRGRVAAFGWRYRSFVSPASLARLCSHCFWRRSWRSHSWDFGEIGKQARKKKRKKNRIAVGRGNIKLGQQEIPVHTPRVASDNVSQINIGDNFTMWLNNNSPVQIYNFLCAMITEIDLTSNRIHEMLFEVFLLWLESFRRTRRWFCSAIQRL